jgi:tol-pal system protein YbgF
MTRSSNSIRITTLAVLVPLLLAGTAIAQDKNSSGGLFDNLFNRGEPSQPHQAEPRQSLPREVAQADPGDLTVRLDRLENALRQLTGTIEQLQFQNQQLQMQMQRMQSGVAVPSPAPSGPTPTPPQSRPGNRSDVFDPSQRPNAPGVPRVLGNTSVIAAPEQNGVQYPAQNPAQNPVDEPPVGAPGGRNAGAPLDLSTLTGNAQINQSANQPPSQPPAMADAGPVQKSQPASQLPTPRNAAAAGTQLATLPPTATPQDEYDMAYGYVLHKDYALAEQAFRDFLKKYPSERLVPDAQYWLGESLFQRQRYRDAAESFLAVSTKYDKAGKAPDSLLRLGQSLAALNQMEAACATLAEVGRKFPRASASVKRGVEQELKRAHC